MKSNCMITRKWNISTNEVEFESLLKDNHIEVIGLKEYQTKTVYTLKRNNITMERVDFPLTNKLDVKGFTQTIIKSMDMLEMIEKEKAK